MRHVLVFFQDDKADGHDRQQRSERHNPCQLMFHGHEEYRDAQYNEQTLCRAGIVTTKEVVEKVSYGQPGCDAQYNRNRDTGGLPYEIGFLTRVKANETAVDNNHEHVVDRRSRQDQSWNTFRRTFTLIHELNHQGNDDCG